MADLLAKVAREAGMPPHGPHTLRHTFCSHLAMRGAPPRAIQELAGHRELGMTQRYMHLSPAALDSAIRWIARVRLKADTTYAPFPKNPVETFWRRGGFPKERSMNRTT